MNQRIQELERQAEKFVMSIPASLDINEYTSVFNEKFAQLIVEEVYDYILNATFDDEPWPSRKDVRQHFGVEQ